MNERIKELKIQACKWASENAPMSEYENVCDEKFAELLIRECALRCEHIAVKHQVEETTYAAGKKAGAFECAADLKNHFGVK